MNAVSWGRFPRRGKCGENQRFSLHTVSHKFIHSFGRSCSNITYPGECREILVFARRAAESQDTWKSCCGMSSFPLPKQSL